VALEKTNTALLNEKKSLQTTNQTFRSQISELESSLLTREENARALTTQVENLTSQQTTNAASRNELKNQNKQLEKRLDEQRLDTELLETENAGLLNRLQLLEQKHAAALARAASTNASKAVALQESSVPTDAIDRFGAAHQLSADGRLEEAIEAYQALMRDFPQLPQSYNNLAALFAAGGDLEQAEALLRRGLELDNNYRTVRQNLSTLLIYRASRVYREAVDEQGGVTESENSRSIPLLEFELLTSTGQTD
jgi:tetratricopeptide (TPR) repeat protein